MDYGNKKRPSMHVNELLLGSVTLLQLAFLGESDPNFPWDKFPLGQQSVKKNLKKNQTIVAHNDPVLTCFARLV